MAEFMRIDDRGFTLTELLITTALSGFVAMAAYTIFSSSNWSATVQQDVSQTQQSVRAATDRLAKDLRSAGFGTPDPPFTLDFNGTTFSAPVTITNSATGPDSMTIVGIGTEVGRLSGSACNVASSTVICFSPSSEFDTQNRFASTVLSVRRNISIGGIATFRLKGTQGQLTSNKLELDSGTLGQNFPDGTPIFLVQAITYSVSTSTSIGGCSATTPCLVGNDITQLRGTGNQLYAEGIEDMQLGYFIRGGTGFVNNASTSDSNLMAVRLNLVARTLKPDPKASSGQARICLEDRAGDSVCTSASDGYRRRSLSQVVMVRNPRTGS